MDHRNYGFRVPENAALALALITPTPMNRKSGSLVDFRSFMDPWYALFSLGMLLVVLGLYFVYYYVSFYLAPVNKMLALTCASDHVFRPGCSSRIVFHIARPATRHEWPWSTWTAGTCMDRKPLSRASKHAHHCLHIDWYTHLHMGGHRFVVGSLVFRGCLRICCGQFTKHGTSSSGEFRT